MYRDWMMPWRSIEDFQTINRPGDSRIWLALPIEEPGTRECAVNGASSVDGKNPAVSCRRGYAAPLGLAPPRTRDRCCRPPCFCRSSRCPSWCWHPDADAVLLPHPGEWQEAMHRRCEAPGQEPSHIEIGALYHDERTPASAGLRLVYHRAFQFAPEGYCHVRQVTSTSEARTRQTHSGPSLPNGIIRRTRSVPPRT